MTAATLNGHPDVLSDVSNDGEMAISTTMPYVVEVTIEGTAALLFHRWSCDSVEAKSKAAKGSAAKKSDDVESYLWRDDQHRICLPGEYLRMSLCDPRNGAAKYRQDPRSPRKSALDLYKAGVVALTDLTPILTPVKGDRWESATTWDYLDRRRVMVQRNGITRERPAFHAGWKAVVQLQVLTPEYIEPMALHSVLNDAGRLVGIGDFRPTFGRFAVTRFDVGAA
jgi:hypothetical protein